MPRFRRSRRKSGRRRRGGRGFARLAHRIVQAGSQPKKLVLYDNVGDNLVSGDATSRSLVIMNPPSNLIQGDTKNNFQGDTVFLKALSIRFAASVTSSPGFVSFYIRWTMFRSRSNAQNMLGSGNVYASGTTDTAVPVQVSPLANPRIFDDSTTVPSKFVGRSFATPFDTTNVRIMKTKTFKINAGGAGQGPTVKKFMFRINKTHRYLDPFEAPLTTAPNHGKYGSVYLMYQVFALTGPGNIASTVVGTMDSRVTLHFRDP